ncbi:MAG: hypothetical protein Q4F88_04480 [Eubacteriales bacterium]|nr:hypothetical protein [Eubacteriales bacterium]
MKNKNKILYFIIALLIIVIVFLSYYLFQNKSVDKQINEVSQIEESLGMIIATPSNTSNITSMNIIDNNISEIIYNHNNIDMIFRATLASNVDLSRMSYEWDPQFILMNVKCDDESEIEVISWTSIDNRAIIKSEWTDNGYHYAMTSINATATETFLKEVDRMARENHNKTK